MTMGRMLSPQASKLLVGLRQAPDDVASHLVFADAISAEDDPQGELIVLMHGLIGGLERLRVLGYGFNILESFPEELFSLSNLEELDLFACDLPKEIPAGFEKLEKLRTIDLRYSSWSDRKREVQKVLPEGCAFRD